ncbi:hypothetical protein ACP4OV_013028 [Aristida adscensionis]
MATPDHKATGSSSCSCSAPLVVWDCGSALYDSHELAAFKRQLDAAVLACRSLSMPHLTATGATAPAPPDPDVVAQAAGRRRRRRRRRLPALLRRLFSKVLRLRLFPAAGARGAAYRADGSAGAGSPWSGALTSIPEESGGSSSPEKGSSPVEAGPSALRKAQSERFVVGSKTPASSMVQFEVVL